MWYNARYIASGGTLYVRKLDPFYLDGVLVKPPPLQMPLFIYFLSLFALLDSPRLARLVMGLFYCCLTYFLHSKIKNHQYRNWILLVYFFNPISINISYLGLFDHIPVLFSLLGTHYLSKERYIISGSFFALGFLTKLYVVYIFFAILPLLLQSKNFSSMLKYGLSFTVITLPLLLFLWINYNDLLFKISLNYHLLRSELSLSIWTNWLKDSQLAIYLTISKLFLVFIPVLLAAIKISNTSINNIYFWNFTTLWIFLLSLNILLTHYFWWAFIFLIFFTSSITNEKSKRYLMGLSFFMLLFSLFGYLWGSYDNYNLSIGISYYQLISATNFLSMLIFLIYQSYELKILHFDCIV